MNTPPVAGAETGAVGAAEGAGAAAGVPAAAAAVAGAPPSRWARMSFLVTRPLMPVPSMREMSTPCSSAILRTTGEERTRRSSSGEY